MNRVKKRFNIIDLVIIVTVIGCLLGVVVRYNFVNRIMALEESETVTVYMTAKELIPGVAESISKRDEFFCVSTDNSLGKPKFVSVAKSRFVYADTNGSPAIGTNDSKKDVRICFEVKGVKNENGFLLNGTQLIVPGNEMVIMSSKGQVSVIITEIRY